MILAYDCSVCVNVRNDIARHLEQMRTMDIIQEDEWSVESLFEQQRDQVQRELSRKFAAIKGNRVFAMVAQDMMNDHNTKIKIR